MKAAEQSVEHYGLSSVWIDTFMREKGPAYLSAAVQYENAIIEGNRRTGNQPFKIVAIYPKEGTFLTQHPIGIPQGDWMTEERKAAAQRFIDFLLEPKTQTLALSVGVRPILPSVPVGEPFTAQWGVSPNLPDIPSFEVPGDDILRRVTDLWLDAKKPASVMMLVDTSGSMNGEAMARAREGAADFIARMHGRDELEVRAFNHVITRLQPVGSVALVGESARQKVNGLFANGGTHLYEVIKGAAQDWEERKKKNPGRHYGIVVMTDGQDEGSAISKADLMDVLPRGDNPETIKIFTIAYGAQADKLFLQELSNRSSARTFESTTSNIGRVYQELSANF
jgi:Ca-activated chloride channel family protein